MKRIKTKAEVFNELEHKIAKPRSLYFEKTNEIHQYLTGLMKN